MGQASDYLREQFMDDNDDGILKCEKIITDAGGKITKGGYINIENIKKFNVTIQNAIDFLIEEWDYSIL